MRSAILVLAYAAPDILALHARYLSGFDFLVHVDAKADLDNFAPAIGLPNVTLLPERLGVFWRGWSSVQAQMMLLRAAVARQYDRVVMISDDSFTLRAPAPLQDALALPGERMEVRPAPDFRDRYDRFFFQDSPATCRRGYNGTDRAFRLEDLDALQAMAALMRQGKLPLETLYFGQAWWSLTRASALLVLDAFDNRPHLRESFRFSDCPDEHFVQNALSVGGSLPQPNRGPLMWADWKRDPKPYTLQTMADILPALDGRHLFARKIRAPALAKALMAHLG